MNRREFALKTVAGCLLASSPNAVYLSASDNSNETRVILNVTCRGGYDGCNIVLPSVEDSVRAFMYRVRPTIYGSALPMTRPANGAWWFENLISIGNESSLDHPGVRLHPLYSRLFDIPGNRIVCPKIDVNGEQVPLSKFIAFKAVWACGPMYAVDLNRGVFSPNKSHEQAQRILHAGNPDPSKSNGYSAVFFDRVVLNAGLFDCIGVGGVSPIELGVSSRGNRLTVPQSFNVSFTAHGGYSFDKAGCRDYQASAGLVPSRNFAAHFIKSVYEYVENSFVEHPWRTRFLSMFSNTRNLIEISERINRVQIETEVNGQSLYDGQFVNFQGQVVQANLYSQLGQALTRFALYEGPDIGNIRYALISIGGNFDSHREQVEGNTSVYPSHASIAGMITGLMYNVVKARLRGKRIKVIICFKTEFGRTLYENGSRGTDHGSGNLFFAVANTDFQQVPKHKIVGPRCYVGRPGQEDFQDPTRVNLDYSRFDLAPKHSTLALQAAILRKYIKRDDVIQEIIPELKYMNPLNQDQRYFADELLGDI